MDSDLRPIENDIGTTYVPSALPTGPSKTLHIQCLTGETNVIVTFCKFKFIKIYLFFKTESKKLLNLVPKSFSFN